MAALELGVELKTALRLLEGSTIWTSTGQKALEEFSSAVEFFFALRPHLGDLTPTRYDLCTRLPEFLNLRVKNALDGMSVQEAVDAGATDGELLALVNSTLRESPELFVRLLQRLSNSKKRPMEQFGSPRTVGAGPFAPAPAPQLAAPPPPATTPALQPAAAAPPLPPLISTTAFNSNRRPHVKPRTSEDGAATCWGSALGRAAVPTAAEEQLAEIPPVAALAPLAPAPLAPAPEAAAPARSRVPSVLQAQAAQAQVSAPFQLAPALAAPACAAAAMPELTESAYADELRVACAATPALTEPLTWSLLTMAEMIGLNTRDRGDAPSLDDSAEELLRAVKTLADMGRHRLPVGAQLAQLAVDAFAGAWLHREAALPYCGELDDGAADPPRFALIRIVTCLAKRLPPAEKSPSATAPAAEPPPGVPVFTLAPSLLGRYRQLASCNRFLHLKTEFSKRHNVSDGGGGKRATALVKEGSATEAILQKGMYWEAALTKQIASTPAPACLAPPGRELPTDASRVRDLALEAFIAAVQPGGDACACGHTAATRLGDDLHEKRHANPACTYQQQLLSISKHALLHEQPGVCLYQAKFEVPAKLYVKHGVDPAVLRFTNFQPDYVYVMPGERPGLRELAIVDAKASAHVKVSHRVQVAAYAWALDGLMDEGGVSKTSRVADMGAIWRPGCAAPDVFPLKEPVRQHEEALAGPLSKQVLTRAAYAKSLEGGVSSLAYGQDCQLRSSCASCEFLSQCRGEAVNPRKLSSVPGLGPASAAALRELADVEDVPGLVSWLRDSGTPKKVKDALKNSNLRNSTAALAALAPAGLADAKPEAALDARVLLAAQNNKHFSPRLQAALDGRVLVRPGAICTTLPAPQEQLGGPAEDIVCVSLLSDPTTGEAYAWAVQTFTAQPGASLLAGTATRPAVAVVPREQFDAAAAYEPPPPPDALERRAAQAASEAASPEGVTLGRGLALRRGLVAELHAALCESSGPNSHLACAVMLDASERAAVLSLLFAVATSSLTAEADLREPAQRCLFACLDGRLVMASHAVGLDAAAEQAAGWARFRQLHAADAPFMAALLPALPTLLELPALGFVTLADVAAHVAAAAPALQQQGGAAALRDFVLGPDADYGRGDSLETTVAALDGDAAYRDWCARAVGGEPRVAELAVRRCRLAAATLDGLRELLRAAGGASQYLPLSAARRGAAMRVQPFESAACGRAALFKCMELRAAGAANRAEWARPLAARLRKGKTLLLRVVGIEVGERDSNMRNIRCEVVPEADGGAPQTAAEKLLPPEARKYGDHWLLAPLTRDGLLSTLRFPDAALAHVTGWNGRALWEAFPQEAHPLRAKLRLGALAPGEVKPDGVKPGSQPSTQSKMVTLRLCLGPKEDVSSRYTALEPETDCAVGALLLLFVRDKDPNGLRVAQHARARVDCPAEWQELLQPGCEVVARGVPGFGDCVALYVCLDGDGNAVLTVIASNTTTLEKPVEARVPRDRIALRFSLFRTLFDHAAVPGVLLPDFDPAVASAAGVWACGADPRALKPMLQLQCAGDPLEEVLDIYAKYFTPTASQLESFKRVLMHRLSAVWGPPGAGKTHFSAGMLLALHLAYARASTPLRVLVCSQTKAATRVLLRKLSDEAEKLVQCHELDPTQFKLFTTDDDGVSPDESKQLVPIERAPYAAELWGRKHCVVGATVWKANTCFAPKSGGVYAPKFDLVLVDEASQLLACDAMLVVDLLDPFSGRLVTVGDHLQMPPVIRGTGYPAGTAGCPSPAASLLEAVRGALKAGGPAAAAHAVSCTLLDNHRMAPQLACFCAAPEGIYPAGFVDCSTTEPPCPCRTRGRGRRLPLRANAEAELSVPWLRRALNPAAELVVVRLPGSASDADEARAAAALLKAACNSWEHKDRFCEEAFVVAPHHRQIALLQGALLHERLLGNGKMSISTVETVQGREAELVLILYALTCPDTIAAEADFLYSLERLNVALTRARQKAVLFLTRAVASPDARAAAAAASPAADEGLAFLRRAAAFSRRRGWYLRLRHRESDSETDDGADGGFEVDSSADSDDEGAHAPPPPGWPHQPFGDPRRMNAANSDDGAVSAEDGHASGAGDDGDDATMYAPEDAFAEERSQDLALRVQTSASLDPPDADWVEAYMAPAAAGGASLRSSQRPFPPPSLSGSLAASPPPSQQPRRHRAPGSAPPGSTVPPESVGFSPPGALLAPPHTVDGSHQRARQWPGGARSAASPQRGPRMFDAAEPRRTPVPSPSDPVEEADSVG